MRLGHLLICGSCCRQEMHGVSESSHEELRFDKGGAPESHRTEFKST